MHKEQNVAQNELQIRVWHPILLQEQLPAFFKCLFSPIYLTEKVAQNFF